MGSCPQVPARQVWLEKRDATGVPFLTGPLMPAPQGPGRTDLRFLAAGWPKVQHLSRLGSVIYHGQP